MYRGYQEQLLREKQPVKKKRRNKKKIFLLWFLVVALVAGFIVLVRAPFLQVTDIEVTGVNAADPAEVASLVQSKLGGSRFFFIPRSSNLFLGRRSLVRTIQAAYPRFANVSIQKINFHTITVTIREYEEWALWCMQPGAEKEECYFMDTNGVVFSPAPFFSGNVYIKVYSKNQSENLVLPFTPFGPDDIPLLKRYFKDLPELGIVPASARFESPYKVVVRFLHGAGASELIINPGADPELVLENLSSALASEPFKGLFRNSGRQLLYIDARSADKVVYKFNGEE